MSKKLIVIFAALMLLASSNVYASLPPQNLLDNGSFENWSHNDSNGQDEFDSWTSSGEAARGKFNASTEEVLTGSYSAKGWAYNNTGVRNMFLRQQISVTGGQTYFFSTYINSSLMDEGDSAWMQVRWFNAGGTAIGSWNLSSSLTSANNSWQLFALDNMLAPDNAAYARIDLRFNALISTSGNLRNAYFDNTWAGTQQNPIAPEPISSSLFVLGGALIFAKKIRKNK